MKHTHQIKLNQYNILISMSNVFIYVHQVQSSDFRQLQMYQIGYLFIGSGKVHEVLRKNLRGARVQKEGNEEYLGHGIIYK